jgi:DNA invertase Pin-like site-specific DNA recombinase
MRAPAYYRMSELGQDTSIPEQKEWARRACPREGIEIVREFEDPGIPGSEIESRPGLQAILAYCEQQAAKGEPFEAIVCWDGDRFSRADSIRSAVCIARLLDAGVTRMFTSEGWIDWTNDVDRVLYNLKQDLSRSAYSKSLSKNVTRSALTRALAGYWSSSRTPYGYISVATNPAWHAWVASGRASFQPPKLCRLQYDAERYEWVRWIFNEYATTAASLGEMAQRLRELGAPPPRARKLKNQDGSFRPWGGEWTRYSVWSILNNRAYLGELRWNAARRGKYSKVSAGEVTTVRTAGTQRGKKKNAAEDVIVVADAHPTLPRWIFSTPAPANSPRRNGRGPRRLPAGASGF